MDGEIVAEKSQIASSCFRGDATPPLGLVRYRFPFTHSPLQAAHRALNAATMPEGQQTVSRYPFAS